MNVTRDPFRQKRQAAGIEYMRAEREAMPLILRLQDVRKTLKGWKTFSNDDPFMIVPHSEAGVRTVRQYPINTDPPDHADYRALVEPFFARPNDPAYQAGMRTLVDEIVAGAARVASIDAVRELALPLQSRALARLLNVDDSEADLWIGWGTHVFKEGDGVAKGSQLADYIRRKFEGTEGSAADDFFSVLNRIDFCGRKLMLEEKHGFANMDFAEHREGLEVLRQDPSRILTATEEFVRYVSPLTAIARRCPNGAKVLDATVAPGGRVGLCWPSANRDQTAFANPDDVVLDRSPNPHVGFGFGIHKCLGAAQARLILRSLLRSLCDQIETIELIEAVAEIEVESSFRRQVGYRRLRVSLKANT